MLNISKIIGKFIKNSSQRDIDKLKSIVKQINALESKIREIPDKDFPAKTLEFKSQIKENHLNAARITHGGYLSALIDAGAGTAAHRSAENAPCVTISLDLKFIGASRLGDEIIGNVKILKKTKSLVFLFCELSCNDKIITSATGVWKILKVKPSS